VGSTVARVLAFNLGLAGLALIAVGVVSTGIDQWNTGGSLWANLNGTFSDGTTVAVYWALFVVPAVLAYHAVLFAARRLEAGRLRALAVAAAPMTMALLLWAESNELEAWELVALAAAALPYGAAVRLPGQPVARRTAILMLVAPLALTVVLLVVAGIAYELSG
jgi:hypothetical protein